MLAYNALPYFTSHITCHTLHAETSFFNHCPLLETIYLNSGNTVNPEQVRSWTFQVNNLLLYNNLACYNIQSGIYAQGQTNLNANKYEWMIIQCVVHKLNSYRTWKWIHWKDNSKTDKTPNFTVFLFGCLWWTISTDFIHRTYLVLSMLIYWIYQPLAVTFIKEEKRVWCS
jgi:hypothetical protein